MGDEGLANGVGHVIESNISGAPDKQSSAEFRPGDMTWIKLRGGSWWPAQIVDENAVCDDFKPSKRKRGEVLVRLYGTYDYSYTNPVSSLLEFNDVLEQNKCTQREMFMKALEQKLSKLQSGRRNARRAKSKANGSVDNEKTSLSKRATEEQDALKKKSKLDDETPQKPQASARRLKVMQDLGLTAPSGSPFLKNGVLSLSP